MDPEFLREMAGDSDVSVRQRVIYYLVSSFMVPVLCNLIRRSEGGFINFYLHGSRVLARDGR